MTLTIFDLIEELSSDELLDHLTALKQNDPDELHDLLLEKNNAGFSNPDDALCETSLQGVIESYNGIDPIALFIIDNCGKELIMEKDKTGWTCLHYACSHDASMQVINKILEIADNVQTNGSRNLIMMKDSKHHATALHHACRSNHKSLDVIYKLLSIGGKELLIQKTDDGENALHRACYCNGDIINIVNILIEFGGYDEDSDGGNGKEIVMEQNDNGCTSLHIACRMYAPLRVIKRLIDVGGKDILCVKNYNGYSPLDESILYDQLHIMRYMLKQCIGNQVGGAFAIGGLFNYANEYAQNKIYEHWSTQIRPILREMASRGDDISHHILLLLHGAIIARAPKTIIIDILSHFEACMMTRDPMKRLPINLAVLNRIKWDDGMKEIIEAMAQARSSKKLTPSAVENNEQQILITAAYYGLQWDNGMKQLADVNMELIGCRCVDDETGLNLFMLAACCGKDEDDGDHVDNVDLSSVYGLLRMCPGCIL